MNAEEKRDVAIENLINYADLQKKKVKEWKISLEDASRGIILFGYPLVELGIIEESEYNNFIYDWFVI